MAGSARSTCLDVTPLQPGSGFNFFQLVELLHRLGGTDQEQGLDHEPEQESIRFKATASLGFPTGDVLQLARDESGRHELEVAFMGLHGSQSPMPGYYLDALAWEYAQGEPKLGLFFDFFHHRLLSLLHRIWRKYRYHVRFQGDGEDGFSRLMFALVGLGDPALSHHMPVHRAKMLAYAGLLASPSRSPEVVADLVAHCFDLTEVQVIPWQLRKVAITAEQQNQLGRACVNLGSNMVIGASVQDYSGKFLLKINKLNLKQFLAFLPNGAHFTPLVTFVSFILRDQLAWDLQLGFCQQDVGGLRLGAGQEMRLGWSSFLGQPPQAPFVNICVQE